MGTDDVKITFGVDVDQAIERVDAFEKATSSAFKKMEGSATSATARMQKPLINIDGSLISAAGGMTAFFMAAMRGRREINAFLEKVFATGRGLLQLRGALTAVVREGFNQLVYMVGRAATAVGDRLVAANDLARKSYDKLQFSLIALSIGIDVYNARAQGSILTMKEMMEFTADLAAQTGVARVEIKRGGATLLEMNKTYGLTKNQLMQLMDRTAKFAVVMGVPFLSALQAVAGAMSGNAQRARFMGLALDDASIAHINAANAAGSDARALQVLGGFMEQTNKIAERFPETLDTVIGQQNRLDAVLKDVNVTMGKGARLAWNPMVNIINLYTLALKAVPDEILIMIGFMRESIGVIFQFIGVVLKLVATLGTLLFAAKVFTLIASWITGVQISMLGLLGPIGLVVAAVGLLAWTVTKYIGSAEAAVEQNSRLAESQNNLFTRNKEAQKQIDTLLAVNEKLGASKDKLIDIELREFNKTGATVVQMWKYIRALKARAAIEKEIAATRAVGTAQKTIDALLLSNEKLGASKERLLKIEAREFSKAGANTEQVRQYIEALKARAAIEEKIAAGKGRGPATDVLKKTIDDNVAAEKAASSKIIEDFRLRKEREAVLTQRAADQIEKISTQKKNSLQQYADYVGDEWRRISDVGLNAMYRMESSLLEFTKTGKLAWHDMANSIIDEMIRIQIQQAIMIPFSSWLGDLLPSLGPVAPGPTRPGQTTPVRIYQPVRAHTGGIIGRDRFPRYSQPLGIASDEELTVIKKEEGVFTPAQMEALGGRQQPVVINITQEFKISATDPQTFRELLKTQFGTIQQATLDGVRQSTGFAREIRGG